MDGSEFFVLIVCGVITFKFFVFYWCVNDWMPDRGALAKRVFKALPAVSGAIMFFTLTAMASFDVVESFTFVVFYMPMGYAFIFLGLKLMPMFFDLYWDYDALHNDNKAAVPAVSGAFIAMSVIYSGANVGDGPGWWCVVFAGGLGFVGWFVLGMIFNMITGISERVTVDRDMGSGIRWGGYLMATGIILARASAGDWTSAGATVVEFMDGWPVLPLMTLMAAAEIFVYKKNDDSGETGKNGLKSSIICGVAFIVVAALVTIFVIRPLPENPIYDSKSNYEAQSYRLTIELDYEIS